MNKFTFAISATDKTTRARAGEIQTPHGVIQTPAFVAVGTQATVKSLTPDEVKELKTQLFFVNTYHIYLRPGVEVISKAGGVHKFMNWDGPLITDSGGFQVFSLGAKRFGKTKGSEGEQSLVKIDEDGVRFTSHWDGAYHYFTPEKSMEIQHILGADLMIAFDECPPYPTTEKYATAAMDRTHRWANRSLTYHRSIHPSPAAPSKNLTQKYQALYGVVQGSTFEHLRVESAKTISALDFDGIAIGGVAVGESKNEMKQVCEWVVPHLPLEKPRHLLGVGEVDDVFTAVEAGMDTFDCVQPTRLARMGHLLIQPNAKSENAHQIIDITKKEFERTLSPIDDTCECYTCAHFTQAYLHHLFRVKELLVYRLATIHNIHFMNQLMIKIRHSIIEGTYSEFRKNWLRGSA